MPCASHYLGNCAQQSRSSPPCALSAAAHQDVAKALLPHAVVEKNSRPDFPEGAPQTYRQLAQRCWDKDASKR